MTVPSPVAVAGSSPLARGLLGHLEGDVVIQGIIPARAGFTPRRVGDGGGAQDHPRSRGVYPPPAAGSRPWWGSSPLARGLHYVLTWEGLRRRIIPARAGFTSRHLGPDPRIQDHPRSRGVYHPLRPASDNVSGSSPLARGLLTWETFDERTRGIIPARAGFTPEQVSYGGLATDHPRSRGVYPCADSAGSPSSGSSPLARGLLTTPVFRSRRSRIIPARAGFTR